MVVNTGERMIRFISRKGSGSSKRDRAALMINDSFVASTQIENEETICGYLELGLSRVGKSVKIVKCGVFRWTPNH